MSEQSPHSGSYLAAEGETWVTMAHYEELLAERDRLFEQYGTLHAAALALLESADDQTHPDDGFPIEEWLNLVDAVRGSNPTNVPGVSTANPPPAASPATIHPAEADGLEPDQFVTEPIDLGIPIDDEKVAQKIEDRKAVEEGYFRDDYPDLNQERSPATKPEGT